MLTALLLLAATPVPAAEALAPRYARNGEDIRIDVLLLAPGHWPRHIANAWQP